MIEKMKPQPVNQFGGHPAAECTFNALCLRSCQLILARLSKARTAILSESLHQAAGHERMLQLALNEAEALAWQTAYPHLVFPALAMEKVQEIVAWRIHQRSVRRADPRLALAA
jgi:hypothetical protein